MGPGKNMSLDDNVRAGAAQLAAPAMHLSGGDEQCAQTRPATHRPIQTEQPSSEAVFFSDTALATHCAPSHYTPQIHWLARCEVTDSLTKAAWTIPAVRPRSKSAPRDTHAPLQRQTRPLVGGVSCPVQWVPFFLAMHMTLPPPASAAAAKTEAAAEAAESVQAAAGAMEVAAAAAAAEDAKAEAAEATTTAAAAATTEPMEAVEPEPGPGPGPGAVPGAGAGAGESEAAGRRPTRGSYEHGLHALSSWFAPLPSVGLGTFLFFGLLLSCAATRPRLRGYDASNSNPSRVSRAGIGPTRRWLILGWLAVASGFRLPEDKGVTQIGAGVELAHSSPLSSHESTISGEVDSAHDRRRLVSGSVCDHSWCVSLRGPPPLLPSTSLRHSLLLSCSQRLQLRLCRY